MSANLTTCSSELERKNEFPKFSFDSVLLGSKVYRRTCESSWIREMSTEIENGSESKTGGPNSTNSVSSKSAIVSGGGCASSPGDFGVSCRRHDDSEAQSIPPFEHDGEHEGRDILKFSGLELAEFRSPSIDPTVPETRGRAERSPKLKYHSPGHRVPFNLEIWSFGCVMLALAWWLASGRKKSEATEISRYANLFESLAGGSRTSTNEVQIRTNMLWDVVRWGGWRCCPEPAFDDSFQELVSQHGSAGSASARGMPISRCARVIL